MSGYAVSKYGVRGVTRTLAREFGNDNIRVNTLVPGWVMTERQKRLWVDEEAEKMIDQVQCLPGRLMPEDVPDWFLFSLPMTARCIPRRISSWTQGGFEFQIKLVLSSRQRVQV